MRILIINVPLFILLTFFGKQINAQCIEGESVFLPHELITYEVAFTWGILWVKGGEVTFKTDTVNYRNEKSYFFESYGSTNNYYNWFFKVDDHFQSWCNLNSLQPIAFRRNTSEGGYWMKNSYEFRQDGQILSSVLHKNEEPKFDTLNAPLCTFDVLSAVYYVRNLDLSNAKSGDEFPINFIIDGELFELPIQYWGKTEMENQSGELIPCEKLSIKLVEGTIFKGEEELFVWLIDDKNKIPLLVEAKVLLGSVKAYLIDFEGLKYKLTGSEDD